MNPELAKLIAHVQADGCVNRRSDDGRTELHYYNTEKQLIEEFRALFRQQFGKEAWQPCIRKTAVQTGTANKEIVKKLLAFQLKEWRIPTEIIDGQRKVKTAYLQAFFDDEGSVVLCKVKRKNKNGSIGESWIRKVKLYSKNREGIFEIQRMLDSLGISSTICKPLKREIYELQIARIESIRKFANLVNFMHPRKRQRLEVLLKTCPPLQ
jgi:intein-encoded DNA endonuclease-like protein